MAQRQVTVTIEEPRLEDISLEIVRKKDGTVAIIVHVEIKDANGAAFLQESFDLSDDVSPTSRQALRQFVLDDVLPAVKQRLINNGRI